jgi:hypothetical protein
MLYAAVNGSVPDTWPEVQELKNLNKSVMVVSKFPGGVLFEDPIALTRASEFNATQCNRGNTTLQANQTLFAYVLLLPARGEEILTMQVPSQ